MKNQIRRYLYTICRILPIKKNRIFFFSYYGSNYGGSPKYLSEYIKNENKEFDIVWAFVDCKKHQYLKKNYKLVKYNSIRYYYYLATSKVIITNYRMTIEFKKRNKQTYIQTWHSSLRLKHIEKDAENTLSKKYIQMAKNDSKQIDFLLAGNRASKDIFKKSFWYTGIILECGTPQCDIFFKDNKNIDHKVRNKLNIDTTSKIVLYAPTFRKNHDLNVYDLDYELLRKMLIRKFGGNWNILVRLHPHIQQNANFINYNSYIKNASDYDDVQELLAISDILITDYSAIMFDFILTRKPCFLYLSDFEEYIKNDRNLYFDINKLPFEKIYNSDDLHTVIEQFDINEYKNKCEAFIENDIESYDDGNACKRVFQSLY